jgi:hypothetical protein
MPAQASESRERTEKLSGKRVIDVVVTLKYNGAVDSGFRIKQAPLTSESMA